MNEDGYRSCVLHQLFRATYKSRNLPDERASHVLRAWLCGYLDISLNLRQPECRCLISGFSPESSKFSQKADHLRMR